MKLVPNLINPYWPDEPERLLLIAELQILRQWLEKNAANEPFYSEDGMGGRVENLIDALSAGTCEDFNYCFG